MVAAQVPRLPAGAAGQTDEAESARQIGRDGAGGQKAILQAGVFVVNGLQPAHLLLDGVTLIV